MASKTKYIFVMGGVLSGLGKGIATASIAKLLQSKGYKVTAMKIDPYLNVDAGTMNPIEHGEVFVTKDGLECDQDIGNYERFLDQELTKDNYMTTGQVYASVIQRERNLEYEGKCVDPVPYTVEEITRRIKLLARKSQADFILIEIGGTVGEYQNSIYFEAARLMHLNNPRQVLFILLSYLPIPGKIGEMKTKPTQHAVRTLNSMGIQPDFVLGRATVPMDDSRKRKISITCNLNKQDIISAPDVEYIYDIPLNFEQDGLTKQILKKFKLRAKKQDLKEWQIFINKIKNSKQILNIGIIGKYFATGKFVLADSYISVIEAIKHAGWYQNCQVNLNWIDSDKYEKSPNELKELKQFDGIIVPGGFGKRGVEGKILAIGYARKNKIPFLGLCYGMQLATIEFARNVAGFKNANSTEINSKTPYPVIDILPEQKEKIKNKDYGGSMRLGDYPCVLKAKTKVQQVYKTDEIIERHRHRYEFNNKYRQELENKGLIFSGTSPDGKLVEMIELPNHPFFVACQFHPEFKSRPIHPHPLFKEFIKSCQK
ncbi:MAG: CTP synthase [Patescibacteria group bacterium]|jgi:CTP synthase|nr:CTP synthase [Patescibacteria group bacterium]